MVDYLSMEFLLGRSFVNALINEGVYAEFEEAFKRWAKNLPMSANKKDPGLSGGLAVWPASSTLWQPCAFRP